MQEQLQLRSENVRETALQTPGQWGTRAGESLAAHGEDHGEARCDLAAHRGHGGAEIHLHPMGNPTPEQGDTQRRL